MRRILVTIVSHDRPGIIHQVSRALADLGCAVFEVSQTTLMGEFAGLFSGGLPAEKNLAGFGDDLGRALAGSGLAHWVAEAQTGPGAPPPGEAEPYVLTLRGLDQGGIIPEFSGSLAGFEVNIDNLRTVALGSDGAGGGHQVLMFFELSVPRSVNQRGFRQALSLMAEELGLEMSLQHRNIFEAIHRL
ncbi:MAG: hypothetical protein LBP55_07785 [Candidatus Adiutrix sp.]|jgi:glycine cleavage system transcriptional repressor|nr:hypothetical protein [Candidatus Adiutrix sp.]